MYHHPVNGLGRDMERFSTNGIGMFWPNPSQPVPLPSLLVMKLWLLGLWVPIVGAFHMIDCIVQFDVILMIFLSYLLPIDENEKE